MPLIVLSFLLSPMCFSCKSLVRIVFFFFFLRNSFFCKKFTIVLYGFCHPYQLTLPALTQHKVERLLFRRKTQNPEPEPLAIQTTKKNLTMHLMYSIDETTGKRLYTLKKAAPDGKASTSAHPGIHSFSSPNLHRKFMSIFFSTRNVHQLTLVYFFYYLFHSSSSSFHSTFLSRRQIFIPARHLQKALWSPSDAATTGAHVSLYILPVNR